MDPFSCALNLRESDANSIPVLFQKELRNRKCLKARFLFRSSIRPFSPESRKMFVCALDAEEEREDLPDQFVLVVIVT